MNYNFKNKVALITGGTTGLGLKLVQNFLNCNASVVFCSRNPKKVEEIEKKLSAKLQKKQMLIGITADVSNKNDVDKIFDIANKNFSKIDVLINNAGVYGPIGPYEELDWNEWLEALNINLIGSLLTIKRIVPIFKSNKKGKIIQISGGGATSPMPNFSSYSVSKAGIVRMVETISRELIPHNIDVNAVAPGPMNTNMLDQVLNSNPETVGTEFYNKSQEQKNQGGAGFDKAIELINYLSSSKSDGLTGKIISALWDNYKDWNKNLNQIVESDVYTLRRITGRDRNLDWGDK